MSDSTVHYIWIKWLNDTIHVQIWSSAFVPWLIVHLSAENYQRAVYLPWQGRGWSCGSRWKQACVATKDIVIMTVFEDPLLSNGPNSGRGKQHPLQSIHSQEYVGGGHFRWDNFMSQAVTLNATQCEQLDKDCSFSLTTVSVCTMSTWRVSLQQLSKKREAEVSPLKLSEHPTWCQQMADWRRNPPSQLPVHQPASVPQLISSGHCNYPLPPPSQNPASKDPVS